MSLINKRKLAILYMYYVNNERPADIYYHVNYVMKDVVMKKIPKCTVKEIIRRYRLGREDIEFLRKNVDTLMSLEPIYTYEMNRYGGLKMTCKLCGKRMSETPLYYHIKKKHKEYLRGLVMKLVPTAVVMGYET
jgi:hypothetical protein